MNWNRTIKSSTEKFREMKKENINADKDQQSMVKENDKLKMKIKDGIKRVCFYFLLFQ